MPKMYTAKQVIKEVKKGIKGGESVGEALKAFGLTRGQWSGMTYRLSKKTLNNNATYSKGGKAKKKKPLTAADKKAFGRVGKRLQKAVKKAVSKESPTANESAGKRAEMYRALLKASKEESRLLEVEQHSLAVLINE